MCVNMCKHLTQEQAQEGFEAMKPVQFTSEYRHSSQLSVYCW